jgi:hypothetical protein
MIWEKPRTTAFRMTVLRAKIWILNSKRRINAAHLTLTFGMLSTYPVSLTFIHIAKLSITEFHAQCCNFILQSSFAWIKTPRSCDLFSWRYIPNWGLGLPPWNSPFHFGFLDLRQSVGLLGRVISSSQGLYLYTNIEKRTHTHTKHPCSECDSNPRSRLPSERRQCNWLYIFIKMLRKVQMKVGISASKQYVFVASRNFPSHYSTCSQRTSNPILQVRDCIHTLNRGISEHWTLQRWWVI